VIWSEDSNKRFNNAIKPKNQLNWFKAPLLRNYAIVCEIYHLILFDLVSFLKLVFEIHLIYF
jgi:hypothetical protein